MTALTPGTTFAFLPSPLLALEVAETLKYGKAEGIKISIIPLLTDFPIIALSLFIMSWFSKLNIVFASISFLGFLYLTQIGIKGIITKEIKTDIKIEKPQSIKKGLITNFLNPNPYLFWFTVGTPAIITGYNMKPFYAVIYILLFFIPLIGFRILIAILVEKFSFLLSTKGYLIFSKILSSLLIALGLKLLYQGIRLIIK